jgi:hypothetical protein
VKEMEDWINDLKEVLGYDKEEVYKNDNFLEILKDVLSFYFEHAPILIQDPTKNGRTVYNLNYTDKYYTTEDGIKIETIPTGEDGEATVPLIEVGGEGIGRAFVENIRYYSNSVSNCLFVVVSDDDGKHMQKFGYIIF